MELDIKSWKNLSEEDRQVIIVKLTYDFGFGFKLSYRMPYGHETDYSYYDKETNMFSFNYELIRGDDTLNPLFTLLVELRKYMQNMNINSTPIIQRSLKYQFAFDGTVYLHYNDALIEVNLEGERKYLKQLYITAPNTYDANKFAYDFLLKEVGDDPSLKEELDGIYDYWKPSFEYFSESEMDKEFTEVFNEIDAIAATK